MSRVENPITPTEQTPDACVTACLVGCLGGLGKSFDDLLDDLSVYRIPLGQENPTGNSSYFDSDGIVDVLIRHGYYVGLHVSYDDKSLEDMAVYKGYHQNLNLYPPQYIHCKFSTEGFTDYVQNNLDRGRYLLTWLDNRVYSPRGYSKNGYEMHVVTVFGVDCEIGKVAVMDPDSYLEDENRITEIELNHLFDSLWRRPDSPWAMERIIVVGME